MANLISSFKSDYKSFKKLSKIYSNKFVTFIKKVLFLGFSVLNLIDKNSIMSINILKWSLDNIS